MRIESAFHNNFESISKDFGLSGPVCAVIDVIRATTTMATMLARGAGEIIIAKNKTEAFLLKKVYQEHLLCGEEGGLAPKGFDHGNSPLEFSKMDLKGKNIIMKTTNGTNSFFKTLKGRASFGLSLVNLRAAMESILQKALETGSDILFIPSGEKGRTSYDDFYVAGLAVKYLLRKGLKIELGDDAKIALAFCLGEHSHREALQKSRSASTLIKAGLGEDLSFCAEENVYDAVPVMTRKYCQKEAALRLGRRFVLSLKNHMS